MEQPYPRKSHRDIVLVAGSYYIIIANRTARLRNHGCTGTMCSLYIIAERKKRVGTYCNAGVFCNPRVFFFNRKRLRLHFEYFLPVPVSQKLVRFVPDINVYGIVALGAFNYVYKTEIQHFRALSQLPIIRLLTCKPRAMNPRLLSCSDPYCLTVFYITYTV